MRLLALAAIVVAAGCVAPPSTQSSGTPPAQGWVLDCALGAHEQATAHWVQDCEARATHTQRTKAEPWIAVNPTDPRNIVVAAKDMRPESSAHCVWNGVAVTHDGGQTWNDVTIGGDYASRQPGSPFYGFACNTDAMFAFSADGSLHFGVEMYNVGGQDARGATPLGPIGGEVLLATSHDGGGTWPDVIAFEPPQAPLFSDYSRMVVSPRTGTILEAINGGATGTDVECHLLASADGGKSARPPLVLTLKEDAPGVSVVTGGQTSPSGALCRGLAVNPGTGTVVLGWKDDYTDAHAAYFSRSSDDGMSWTDSNVGFVLHSIPDAFPGMKAPARAGQQFELKYARNGTLYAVTAEAPQGDANVYLRHSQDDGRTWSDAVQVNDARDKPHEQWMPQLALPPDGSVHVFFFDRGYSGSLVDVTHAWLDHGVWQRERVTTHSWDPDLGRHQEGYPWIGDYIGADAVGNDVWAGVPDTSLGGEPVLAAIHVHR